MVDALALGASGSNSVWVQVPPSAPNKKLMKITEKEIKNSTAKVEVLVPKSIVDQTKEVVVDEMIKNVSVKGFRAGKAPKSIAEQNLDSEKLSSHIISHILNDTVAQVIKEKKYQTLGRPVLEKLEPQKDGNIKISLNFPLYPTFKLGKYQDQIKKIAKKDKKIEDIYDCLLKNIKIEVSPLLVEEEAKYGLERLENHAKSLNISLEKYLEATKKTLEEVTKEYQKNAEDSIRLDLILLQIADEEGIVSTKEELSSLITASGAKEDQQEQVKSIIKRRKTLDFLLKL